MKKLYFFRNISFEKSATSQMKKKLQCVSEEEEEIEIIIIQVGKMAGWAEKTYLAARKIINSKIRPNLMTQKQ